MADDFAFENRAELERATRRFLRRRSPIRADLRLLESGGRLAVAKDWSNAPWFMRPFGRWNVWREARILARLAGVEGVPEVLSHTSDGIVLSHLSGRPLSPRQAHEWSAEFFANLEDRVAQIHQRGVVHLDLRQRRNILFGVDDTAFILDFGAAIMVPVWAGAVGRSLMWPGIVTDRLAILNFKAKYRSDLLSPRESRFSWLARIAGLFWPPHWFLHAKSKVWRWWRNQRTRAI